MPCAHVCSRCLLKLTLYGVAIAVGAWLSVPSIAMADAPVVSVPAPTAQEPPVAPVAVELRCTVIVVPGYMVDSFGDLWFRRVYNPEPTDRPKQDRSTACGPIYDSDIDEHEIVLKHDSLCVNGVGTGNLFAQIEGWFLRKDRRISLQTFRLSTTVGSPVTLKYTEAHPEVLPADTEFDLQITPQTGFDGRMILDWSPSTVSHNKSAPPQALSEPVPRYPQALPIRQILALRGLLHSKNATTHRELLVFITPLFAIPQDSISDSGSVPP